MLVTALVCALPAQAVQTRHFAVVVGNNVPAVELPALRYADDDAARLYEFLVAAGHTVRLLTVLDAETQSWMPGVVASSQPPTRARLLQALTALRTEMETAHTAGATVEFTFAFAGHGTGSADGGAIHLLDGSFTREELMQFVVKDNPADFIHIIIDACDSYFMVASRGGENYPDDRVDSGATAELVRSYLEGDGPAQDARVGFLVSTNQAAQSHEYNGFRAGVFSHVVHSALAGAADANRDGRVEYTEVLAYAAAASQAIQDPRARLAIHGRAPPRDIHRAVMDLRSSTFTHFLRLGADVKGRVHVEDARSVSYADLHKPQGAEVLLALVQSSSYRVTQDDGEARIRIRPDRPGAVRVETFQPVTTRTRGEDGTELRRELFSVPFDESYYRGYVASQSLPGVVGRGGFSPPDTERATLIPGRPRLLFGVPGILLLGAGGLLGVGVGAATALTKLSYDAYAQSLRSTGRVDEGQEQRINALRVATGLLLAAGMAALALGGILVAVELLWPVKTLEETP